MQSRNGIVQFDLIIPTLWPNGAYCIPERFYGERGERKGKEGEDSNSCELYTMNLAIHSQLPACVW